MELDYIKDFIMMAKYEDLFETSERLFISPSTLSRHIKSIEDDLNVQLFERSSRSMKLNQYGEIFLNYSKQMIQLDDICRKVLNNEQERNGDVLHVATLGAANGYLISGLLESFKRGYPAYQVYVHEADTMENWERLRRLECDFVFVLERKEEHIGVDRICFGSDVLAAIMPKKHPLTGYRAVNAYLLRTEPLLLFDKCCYIHQLCQSLFEKEKIKPKVAVTAFRGENLIDLVQKEMGIAILMQEEARENIADDICILPIEPEVKVNINLVYRQARKFREIDKEFLKHAELVLNR